MRIACLLVPDLPLAAELRNAGVENPIGFFLHVPFPSYEALRAAPGHEFLLRCMCAYDVIGFHTAGDLAAFQTCVREPIVGAEFLDRNRVKLPGGELIAEAAPPAVTALDTVGAGDAFTAALTVALVEGQEPLDALRFACSAGAAAAARAGAQPSLPTRAEVEALLSEL
mgnify:CR=1 FL=1